VPAAVTAPSDGTIAETLTAAMSPAPATVALGLSAGTPREWAAFVRKYRAEMARPENSRVLDLLAALSHAASFSVGCYCADQARCHRSVLRELLLERGAMVL